MSQHIDLTIFEDVSVFEKNLALEILKNHFSLKICITHANYPEYSYDSNRCQFKAETLKHYLLFNKTGIINIGLCASDIYAKNFNFVFGLADISYKVPIISIFRLKSEKYEIFYSRIKKILLHEIAHCYGLNHCKYNCIMQFSKNLEEFDKKNITFCKYHLKEFKKNVIFFQDKILATIEYNPKNIKGITGKPYMK